MHSGRVFLLHFKSFRLAYPTGVFTTRSCRGHTGGSKRLFQGVYPFRLPTATLYTIRKKKEGFFVLHSS